MELCPSTTLCYLKRIYLHYNAYMSYVKSRKKTGIIVKFEV